MTKGQINDLTPNIHSEFELYNAMMTIKSNAISSHGIPLKFLRRHCITTEFSGRLDSTSNGMRGVEAGSGADIGRSRNIFILIFFFVSFTTTVTISPMFRSFANNFRNPKRWKYQYILGRSYANGVWDKFEI
uniref:Uncharacterized protein n=1 Tax=Glossina brevipalpis TaxID=37001 RepID=A0A1A9X1S5_9MUSC